MSGFAWVTLATNDSYSLGALVLAHSLRQVGTAHHVAVLVTPGVTNAMRQKLSAVFNVVQEVNILDSKDEKNLRLLKRPELGVTFTKLHCWRLTQFEKCVFMDADTLVLSNSDELFEREEFSASPDVGWPDCFNSGVFVYRPSNETYDKLIDFAMQKGSFDGGDQGLLNLYFSDWAHKDISKHLPFIYNMCSTACYSYMPAFKQYGADVKIVHFVGPAKPWLQYFDTQTRKVHPSSGFQHMEVILQRWWDIFCSLIHPNLSPDMSGLAGAFAQFTLGVKRTPSQDALENHLRRQAWEVGNIDYMGRDSFDNIWSKICETLAATPLETPAEPKPIEQTSSDASTQEKPTVSVEPAPKEVAGDVKEELPQATTKPETPQQIITIAETPVSKIPVEAEPIISQEIKSEPAAEVTVETPVETSSEVPKETKPELQPQQTDILQEIPAETKPEPQPEVTQEIQAAITTPEGLVEIVTSEGKPPETQTTEIPKQEGPQEVAAEALKQGETPEVPKIEEQKLPEITTPAATAGVDIPKIQEQQEVEKLEETLKPAESITPGATKVEVLPDAPKSEELPKEPTKTEGVEAKIEEPSKIIETPKAEVEATPPSTTTEIPKVEEASKLEAAPKLEDTTKLEEASKIEDLPKIQETAKPDEVSVIKETKMEDTTKTEPVVPPQKIEELPKEESKVGTPEAQELPKMESVPAPEVQELPKTESVPAPEELPKIESVPAPESQEVPKIESVPAPEEAVKIEPVSQVEVPKVEGPSSDAKVEVATKPEEKQTVLDTKVESPKLQESATEAAKCPVGQTVKESPKTEEAPKESPKTEETPKEATKVKKVSKDGKERKVKKVPKSDVKTDSSQEGAASSETAVTEGESSTAALTETPTPPPRKTPAGVKKVKAKKPSP